MKVNELPEKLAPRDVYHVQVATQYYTGGGNGNESLDTARDVGNVDVSELRAAVSRYLSDLYAAKPQYKSLLSKQVDEVVRLNVKLYPNAAVAA